MQFLVFFDMDSLPFFTQVFITIIFTLYIPLSPLISLGFTKRHPELFIVIQWHYKNKTKKCLIQNVAQNTSFSRLNLYSQISAVYHTHVPACQALGSCRAEHPIQRILRAYWDEDRSKMLGRAARSHYVRINHAVRVVCGALGAFESNPDVRCCRLVLRLTYCRQ